MLNGVANLTVIEDATEIEFLPFIKNNRGRRREKREEEAQRREGGGEGGRGKGRGGRVGERGDRSGEKRGEVRVDKFATLVAQ